MTNSIDKANQYIWKKAQAGDQEALNLVNEINTLIIDEHLKQTQEFEDNFTPHFYFSWLVENPMSALTPGEIKCIFIIWFFTLAMGKRSTKITNEKFMQLGGKNLTKKDQVIAATESLKEKGLIFKVLDKQLDWVNWYSLNQNIEGVSPFWQD